MLIHHLLGDALRVAVLLALALVAMPLLRGTSSATRRLVLAISLGGALMLPLVSAAVPSWRVRAPAAVESLRGVVIADPLVPASTSAPVSTRGRAMSVSPLRAEPARSFGALAVVAWVWACGAALVLARMLVGLAGTRRIVRRATGARAWSLAAARAGSTTGQRVDVRATGELDAPAVAGVLAPVILVPHASASWTDERRYAVLLHELAHVRQRDCLTQLIAQLLCAVHWFNPLVWLAARRLRVERELAADDAVVAAGARASSYAEDLLAIACAAGVARDVPSGALGMAERSLLAARVTSIVSAQRMRRPPTAAGTALVLASVGAGVLAVACATPETVTATKAGPSTTAAALPASAPAGSTLDPRLQSIAEEELGHAMDEWKAAAGTVLVLDPSTGEILANAGRAHGAAADVAVRSAYVTGSTLKAFTLAAAFEESVVSPTDRFDCEHGAWIYQGETIHDAHSQGLLTVSEMLAVSSNIGFAKIYDRLGGDRLGRWLRAFHFGTAPGIEGAVAGWMPERIEERSAAGAIVAIGEKLTASPLQVAAAYAVLANGGFYVAPTLTRRTEEAPRERVLKPETAHTIVTMLEGVVSSEQATGTRARVDGQRVAGKTGTASWEMPGGGDRYYSSFVGIVPSTSPRFVILVGLEDPQGEQAGGIVAAPVFSRVATRALGR
jgi:beta-lactamase regulating signal transducer with metallopeptidase domain